MKCLFIIFFLSTNFLQFLNSNSLSHCFKSWKIKINDSKFSHITFSLRPGNCPHITFENTIILHTNEVKYLGLLLDRRFTWGPFLKTKRKQLNSRLHILRPLMKSNMSISNRLLLYKSLLQPIWSTESLSGVLLNHRTQEPFKHSKSSAS